ncbi:DEAD/DEAH box helicase [Vibrio alginolyticus]|uniref:UvrD-helicase domain-containing protein n=1 Tax=Vibrio TaxID=662 RepID=UPI001BD5C4D2|nr:MULTISPECIES: UvrD-helicase domain-containing protein [Vibrio]MBS9996660.1 DEAD/DEAH box helicase [Vibrio alginolyticus]MBT0110241.1 DEAD/DEAH box helicase [Vibrio alginolyticus]MDW1924709.1 3'-5' exonuclease [Vibrio sp. 947]
MTAQHKPDIAFGQDFVKSLVNIPPRQQKKVNDFISKFHKNPTSSGINYEKINNAGDNNMRSVRIDQAYRCILLKPESGNTYVMLWVDHHDDAYEWASRHTCKIHPSTGSIQIVPTSILSDAEVPATEKPIEERLFKELRERQLLAIGVPESMAARVANVVDEKELESLEKRLPVEAYEALYLLAAGESYDSVYLEYSGEGGDVDTNDFDAALKRTVTQRSFAIITDDLELQNMLNAPLEMWRVFLHPSQRKLVAKQNNGPVRVLGGAGTGKTVVAMHRAVHLAKGLVKSGKGKILFTTFTKNLAKDIEQNLKKIATTEELERIDVVNIDGFVRQFLQHQNYDFKVVFDNDSDLQKCWDSALALSDGALGLPDSFYKEEWLHVVQKLNVTTKAEYFKVKRIGRGVTLNRAKRAKIWPVLEELRLQMMQNRIKDVKDAMSDATQILMDNQFKASYQHVVVDEAQDMSHQAYMFLRQLVPEQADDLFIVGDGHQRIYKNKVVLSQCGINVRGRRSQKLKINYRTTEETKRFAVSILNNVQVDDLDGEADKSSDYLSLFHGEKPIIEHFENKQAELDYIVAQIKSLSSNGVEFKDICVVARTNNIKNDFAESISNCDLPVFEINPNTVDANQEGVRLATMHRVKGLEFRYLFIVSANSGVIPLNILDSDDPIEKKDHDFNERALLHVAATRAITQLFISSYGVQSEYLR